MSMRTLREYYGDPFREDLASVMASGRSSHLHDPDPAIQPRTLSTETPVIRSWNAQQRGLFAAALFITVLSDQVCYTYFRDCYAAFRVLTMYPKLKGDCPGGCSTNIDPSSVFGATGRAPGAWPREDEVNYAALPVDLFAVLAIEIRSFFPARLAAIDPDQFLSHCETSIPSGFRLLHSASRLDDHEERLT